MEDRSIAAALLIEVWGLLTITSFHQPPTHRKRRYKEQTVNLSVACCWQTNEMCHASGESHSNVGVCHIPCFQYVSY
jgi:hypothetical protein